jgi:parallel beta-helix repeat protein
MDRLVKSKNPNDFNVVAATIIDGNGAQIAVRLCMGTTTRFEGFTVTGGDIGIRTEQGARPFISKCIITKNNKAGIMVYQSTTNVTNCIIHDNNNQGILVWSAWCAAQNNVIYDQYEGITIGGFHVTGTFRNNTIVNNKDYGIRRFDEPIMFISNCIIWDNNDDLGDCNAVYSCIKKKSDANGSGNITSDPCFVNPRKMDFHIKANSPCVNAGDPNEEYTDLVDIDNEPRVLGRRIDIGADEVNVPSPGAKQ